MRFPSLLFTSCALTALSFASAEDDAIFQSMYVPLPDTALLNDIFEHINDEAKSPVTTIVSVAISTDDTVIYYDHWEDGYDGDILGSPQGSTEIWGDGDASNGCAPVPGRSCTNASDKLNAGDVALLENNVPIPRVKSNILYDGGDLLQATRPVAMTRAGYPGGPGSMMAGAVEVFEQSSWGSSFEAPVGEDTGSDTDAYEFVALACQAGDKGAKVYENNVQIAHLSQGQGKVVRVKQGAKITSSEPMQVHLITGDMGSTYELRWYALTPTEQWSNEAYAPVGDTEGEVAVTVYNPSSRAITVHVKTLFKEYDMNVPAKDSAESETIYNGSGARFTCSSKFFAFSATDKVGNGQIFDWGYPLMTRDQLTNTVLIGLGYGCTGNNCDDDGERSVVWVTPVEDADIYVDFDNDGNVDKTYRVGALESKVITDDDEDMSGAVIWATEAGTSKNGAGVDLAAAWGQKAANSFSGDGKALDLGTVVVPFEPVRTSCSIELIEDNDEDDKMSVGDVVNEIIEVVNAGQTTLGAGVLSVMTLGGPIDIESTAPRGGVQTYIIPYTIPEGVDVDAFSCGIIPYIPPAKVDVCLEDGAGSYTMTQILLSDSEGKKLPGDEIEIDGKTYVLSSTCALDPKVDVCLEDGAGSYTMTQILLSDAEGEKVPGDEIVIDGTTYILSSTCALEPTVDVCLEEGADSYAMTQILAADAEGEKVPGDEIVIDGKTYILSSTCALEPTVDVCLEEGANSYAMTQILAADAEGEKVPGDEIVIDGKTYILSSTCALEPTVDVCLEEGGDSYTMTQILAADAAGEKVPGDEIVIDGKTYILSSTCALEPTVDVCLEEGGDSYTMTQILEADAEGEKVPGDEIVIDGNTYILSSTCALEPTVDVCLEEGGGSYTMTQILEADSEGKKVPGDEIVIGGKTYILSSTCALEPMVNVCLEEGGDSYTMTQILEADAEGEKVPGDEIVIDGTTYILTSTCALESTVDVCLDESGDTYTMTQILAADLAGEKVPGDEIVIDGKTYILSSTCNLEPTVDVCLEEGGGSYTMTQILEADSEGTKVPGDEIVIGGTTYILTSTCALEPMVDVCRDEGGDSYTMTQILAADAEGEKVPGDEIVIDGTTYILTSTCNLDPTVDVCLDEGGDSYTMTQILAADAAGEKVPGDEIVIDGTTYILSSTCNLEPTVDVCLDEGGDSYTMTQILAADAEGEKVPGDEIVIDGITYILTSTCNLDPVATPPPTESPTPPPRNGPTDPPKGSSSGDPHFKTWTGAKFDYHGECDLVLVDSPAFADGLGLRLHIRTTRVKYFSFIEKVALQIGDDVLEFDNDVENFLINGVQVKENLKHHKTMLGGFVVRRDKKAISVRLHKEGNAKIDFHTRKNGFPAVIVDAGHTDMFKGSLGLLGEYGSGMKLARDAMTELEDDATAFALEWQVRDNEPMLFKESRFPQFPTVCTPPAKQRVGFSHFRAEAEEACAHWKADMEDCIFDVMATRDVLVAEEGHIVHVE